MSDRLTVTEDATSSVAGSSRRVALAMRPAVALALLLTFTLAKGFLWANMIAPLDAPDEPSHFNYVVQVREGYILPIVDLVSPGGLKTPPSTPLDQNVRDYFARYNYKFFRSMPYESAQPPLYYWLDALWTLPIGISPDTLPALLLAARLFSVALGMGAVLALWLACRWSIVGPAWLVWLAPLALTLSPEFSFTTATVSNDAGALFWGAVLLAVWAFGLRQGREEKPRVAWRIAALVGLSALVTAAGTLTKLTFVATVPATLLWIWWLVGLRQGQQYQPASARTGSHLRRWLPASLAFSLLSAAPLAPWVVRNLREYGEPTGTQAILNLIHNIYWQRMQFPKGQLFSQFPVDDFVVRSFRSFWALFGWATVWLDDWVYWLLAAFMAFALLGLVVAAIRGGKAAPTRPPGRLVLLAAITCLLAFANYVGYNSLVEFQPHIRYTFVALAPAFLLLAVGFGRGVGGARLRLAVASAFVILLVGVHVWSLLALWTHTQYVLSVAG